MSTHVDAFVQNILDQLYLATQVDLLHLSVINLLDMIKDGEIDLMLEQGNKSLKQKALFIQKIIDSVESTELQDALQKALHDAINKKEGLQFFSEKSLGAVLRSLQEIAEQITIVKLQVAIEFKPTDLKEMMKLLEEKLDRKVALAISQEKSLIGGVIIQVGNYLSDYSVKTRLEQFRGHWHRAVVEGA